MISLVPTIALLWLGQISNQPYARKHVDSTDPSSHCFWWPSGTVTYNQSSSGNGTTNGGTEFAAVSAAWHSWEDILSGDSSNLTLAEGPRTSSRTVGYDSANTASNQNVVMFRTVDCRSLVASNDGCWSAGDCGNTHDCWDHDPSTIALTTSTYDKSTGKLYDADEEINGASFYFTTVDSPPCVSEPYTQACVAYDIQNATTHETGHVLGLDHTTFPGSVMNPSANVGETSKRTIDEGSKSFIAAAYPPGQPSQDCVPASKSGCAATGMELAWGLGLLTLIALYRRTRTRRV